MCIYLYHSLPHYSHIFTVILMHQLLSVATPIILILLQEGVTSRAAVTLTSFVEWNLCHSGTLPKNWQERSFSHWTDLTLEAPKKRCTSQGDENDVELTIAAALLERSTGRQSWARHWPSWASHIATFRNFWLWRVPKIGRGCCWRFLGKSLDVQWEKCTSQLVTLRDAAC